MPAVSGNEVARGDFWKKSYAFIEDVNNWSRTAKIENNAGGLPSLNAVGEDRIDLAVKLIDEEVGELKAALESQDIIEIADALGDIMVVVAQMGYVLGIPMISVTQEIMTSNWSKFNNGKVVIADGSEEGKPAGKILKGENYQPPRISAAIVKGIPREFALDINPPAPEVPTTRRSSW